MKLVETPLPGVLLVKPDVFGDERGFFMETWNLRRYQDAGFPDVGFVQDNHSRSCKGVLRGLHFQQRHPQGKLVQVTTGVVFDVAVDIRVGSPTFGQWYGTVLDETNHHQLWMSPGFAHGFCVLSEVADLTYKCTDFYDPEDDCGIVWSDPDIGIEWPLEMPCLSKKDQGLPRFRDISQDKLPVFSL